MILYSLKLKKVSRRTNATFYDYTLRVSFIRLFIVVIKIRVELSGNLAHTRVFIVSFIHSATKNASSREIFGQSRLK